MLPGLAKVADERLPHCFRTGEACLPCPAGYARLLPGSSTANRASLPGIARHLQQHLAARACAGPESTVT